MDSILFQLYEMKMMPCVQIEAKEELRQRRRNACFQKNQSVFDCLKGLDSAIYDDIVSILEELLEQNRMEAEDMFCQGVAVGTQLMVEAFTIA